MYWCCDWLDVEKREFTPVFDLCSCGKRDDFYPWGDCVCCETDAAWCGIFEVPLMSEEALEETEFASGFCDICGPDCFPQFWKGVCCPCCSAAESFSVMRGERADGWCGVGGAAFCWCNMFCGWLGGGTTVPICTIIERRYIMKR